MSELDGSFKSGKFRYFSKSNNRIIPVYAKIEGFHVSLFIMKEDGSMELIKQMDLSEFQQKFNAGDITLGW